MFVSSFFFFFFFKRKTAYEMRISDWSSDVCSSDLSTPVPRLRRVRQRRLPVPVRPAGREYHRRRAARGRCPALRRALSRAGSTTRYLPSTALATSRPCRPPSVRPGVGAVNHLLPAGGGACPVLLSPPYCSLSGSTGPIRGLSPVPPASAAATFREIGRAHV